MLVSDADPTRRAPVDVALNEVVEDELLVAHADIGAIADAGRTTRIGPFDYGIRIDLREPLICIHGQLPRRARRWRRSPSRPARAGRRFDGLHQCQHEHSPARP
jgi:hypothetical protein